MTDQTTLPAARADAGRRRRLVRPVVEAVTILVVFALAGAACGWLWERRWTAPEGIAYKGKWYVDGTVAGYGSSVTGIDRLFNGTGSYVVIAALAGLVLGLVFAWVFTASEIGTVLAVLAGACLAAWIMYTVGTHLAPGDPAERAKGAKDLAKLTGTLRTYGDSYRVAFPGAAMIGPTLVYLCFPARRRREAADPFGS